MAFKSTAFQQMLLEKGHLFDDHDKWPCDPEAAGNIIMEREIMKNLTPQEQSEYMFWENIKSNGYDVPTAATKGNPIGKRWDRAIRSKTPCGEALRQEYSKRQDGPEKAEFRKNWAQKQYKLKSTKWAVTQKETRENWKKSVYAPLGRMAHFEGGGIAGWMQATRA